jgi:alpha-soluble NSF attachment protein
MDKEYEARQLVERAEKKLKPGFFASLMSSKESRLEEALDLYEKAGNMFKLTKKWAEAGECFERCGQIEEQLKADAASHYQDAAHCFNFVNKTRANDNLNKCLRIYEIQGRFQMAGKIQKQIAEEYEADLQYDLAINAYGKAAEYFSMENINSKSYEQGCLIKQADLMCSIDHKDTFEITRNVSNYNLYY